MSEPVAVLATCTEVSDEVYEVILLSIPQKNNYDSRMYYHKAHYSLDCDDGIESDALHRMSSPEEILMQKVSFSGFGQPFAGQLMTLACEQ